VGSAHCRYALPGDASRPDFHTFSVLPTARVWFREDPNQGAESLPRDSNRSDLEIDAEIEGEAHERGRYHKRQKREDLAGERVHGGSKSTESSKAIPTPTCTEGMESLRYTWLQKERLRSDPDNKWSEEESWASYIRDGDRVNRAQQVRSHTRKRIWRRRENRRTFHSAHSMAHSTPWHIPFQLVIEFPG
jgi:hypothetical protein